MKIQEQAFGLHRHAKVPQQEIIVLNDQHEH
jgi:hypothetical protein